MPHSETVARLRGHYQSMPPVRGMALDIAGYDGHTLELRAPLAAHVNDKGSAFGGSLAAVATLAGWGLVVAGLEAAGLDAEVYVADSRLDYRLPLREDLHVVARLAPGADWNAFATTLRRRGRARIGVQAQVLAGDGRVATAFDARFVAIRDVQPAPVAAAG